MRILHTIAMTTPTALIPRGPSIALVIQDIQGTVSTVSVCKYNNQMVNVNS